MQLARLWRHFQREFLWRRLPHGLLGPGYLWPGHDARIRLHRDLWWQSGQRWPRPLWLMVELGLWLRWQLCHAIPACWQVVQQFGPSVEQHEGIARWVQARHILKLALFWCIPPGESYRYKLYSASDKSLDYIFNSETQAYHAWRSRDLGWQPEALKRLQDKALFAEVLGRGGLPVIHHLAIAPQHSDLTVLSDTLRRHDGRVFCKMNSGNQGRGAFSAWLTADGITGQSFTGQNLPNSSAVEKAWQGLLKLDAALIQPCLMNHPDLAPLAFNDDAITVRYISQWVDGDADIAPMQVACLSATLEVPSGQINGQTFYTIFPIDPENGVLKPPIPAPFAEPAVQQSLRHVAAMAANLPRLPFWPQLMEASHTAHQLFPEVLTIAWDWVLTPTGPVLLEGNTGWGCATPQLINGGFAR